MVQLNRREAIKASITGGAALALTPAVLLQTGCSSKTQLVKWSLVGLQTLKEVSPVLEELGATEIVSLIDQALPYAEKLKNALESDDHDSAGQWLEKLTGTDGWLAKIANAAGFLRDDTRKKIILGSLATAQIMYRLIYAQIQVDAPQAVAAAAKAQPERAKAMARTMKPDKLTAAFEATRF